MSKKSTGIFYIVCGVLLLLAAVAYGIDLLVNPASIGALKIIRAPAVGIAGIGLLVIGWRAASDRRPPGQA